MSEFSKTWPSGADPATDHVVRHLPDGTGVTRDGYFIEAAPHLPPILRYERIVFEKVED